MNLLRPTTLALTLLATISASTRECIFPIVQSEKADIIWPDKAK